VQRPPFPGAAVAMSDFAPIAAARALLARWAEVFNTRQPERIVELYADDALLHGTSQARLYLGREQIRSYFRGTSTVTFGEQHFVELSEDSVLCVGKYTFARQQDGQPVVAPARFTFVARRRDGVWQILHHHSSAEPN
jgi:uncharacterized protein (TIGR02246 family)